MKEMKRECEEQQRRYNALRSLKTANPNNTYHQEAANAQMIQQLVVQVQMLTKQQTSATKEILRAVGRVSQTSETTASSPVAPDGPPAQPDQQGPLDQLGQPSTQYRGVVTTTATAMIPDTQVAPGTPTQVTIIPSTGRGRGDTSNVTEQRRRETASPEHMFVIHDNGKMVTEEWRRPRQQPLNSDDEASVVSSHSSNQGLD